MKSASLGDAPRTLLYEFAKIKSGDIVLPAEAAGGILTKVRLRHVTELLTAVENGGAGRSKMVALGGVDLS